MNILVTGAEGFVGKNLKEILGRNPKLKIFAPGISELDLVIEEHVSKFLKQNKIDFILHSATITPQGKVYPENVCELNLRMFFNLIKSMSPNTRFINFGSGSEYSRPYWHSKMKEDFFGKHIPPDSHSFAKYLISKYIEDSKQTNMTTFRIFGIYGIYEDYRYKFISNCIAKKIAGIPITINKNCVYDYIYIDDFARIIEQFLYLDKFKFPSYNITPSTSNELLELANLVDGTSDSKVGITVLTEGYGTPCTGNNERLMSELPNFVFTPQEISIRNLTLKLKELTPFINRNELVKDEFLNYAKSIGEKTLSDNN